MNLTVFYFNETSGTWMQTYTTNISTTSGTSLSNTTINGTGRYGYRCSFKKNNYSEYVFGTNFADETVMMYHIWTGTDENSSWIDDGIERVLGESPVKIGETVVAYTALGIALIITFLLFTFSTQFAGFAIIVVALVLGVFREPLHFMGDGMINLMVIVMLFILGFMTIVNTKKKEG